LTNIWGSNGAMGNTSKKYKRQRYDRRRQTNSLPRGAKTGRTKLAKRSQSHLDKETAPFSVDKKSKPVLNAPFPRIGKDGRTFLYPAAARKKKRKASKEGGFGLNS